MNLEILEEGNRHIYNHIVSEFYLTYNGRKLSKENIPLCKDGIKIQPRLVGGKGGFGSMLRAIGARIEKTTNHEACRDLSGRRMRDVNNEKQITEWLQEQETKQQEKVKRHEERIERTLNPKMKYEDVDYTKSLQGNVNKINEAMKFANEKGSIGSKRKPNNKKPSSGKKPKIMMGLEGLSDEEDIESENSDIDDGDIVKASALKEVVETSSIENESDTKKDLEKEIEHEQGEKILEKISIDSNKKDEKISMEPLDLEEFRTADELQSVGLERLKSALMSYGLKCGGTLQERADRLFLIKDKPLEELDPSLFAKKNGKK